MIRISANYLIELKNVSKTYCSGRIEVHALKNINLALKTGDFLSIQGPSGSGKSTLLNIMGCIDIPTHGQLYLEGQDISKLSDHELTKIRLHKIGFIFQQFYLIPTLTAAENIELPMKEAKIPRAEIKETVHELLEIVKLGNRMNHYPNQLSGGEQQRVAIARALANKPKILLADEPTGEIDSATSSRIVNLLKNLNSNRKLTIIIVTHDPKIANVAGRKIRIEYGRIKNL